MPTHRLLLSLEFLLLTVGVPLAMCFLVPVKFLLPTIWLVALYAYVVLKRSGMPSFCSEWRGALLNTQALWPIARRFILCAAALTALTAWIEPTLLFSFLREQPRIWLMVMLLYPLLSVIPQELIFRSFFFHRYLPLFASPHLMALMSAIMFGFSHLLFQNWVAPLLCVAGGWLFATTYARHRSLALVSLEHALYGDFIFTIGLGRYFYHGAV